MHLVGKTSKFIVNKFVAFDKLLWVGAVYKRVMSIGCEAWKYHEFVVEDHLETLVTRPMVVEGVQAGWSDVRQQPLRNSLQTKV